MSENDERLSAMRKEKPSGKRSMLEADPEFWAELVNLIGGSPEETEHLTLAASAPEFSRVRSLGEWKHISSQYPSDPLPRAGRKDMKSARAKLRGVFAAAAIRKLLELQGAPEALVADLEAFFQMPKPPSSKTRGKAQLELIRRSEASLAEIEKASGHKRSEISRDLKARRLLRET